MDQEQYMQALQSLEIQKRYIESYRTQLNAIELQLRELKTAQETIEGYNKLKVGDEILVPVGGDSFVLGKIQDVKNVLSGIGAGITVQESAGKALSRFGEKTEKLTRMQKKLEQELGSIEQQYRTLSRKVESEYAAMMQAKQGGTQAPPLGR